MRPWHGAGLVPIAGAVTNATTHGSLPTVQLSCTLYPSASAQRPRSALGVGIISSISVVISRGCSQPLTRLSPPTQSSPLLSAPYLPAVHRTECHRRTSLASKNLSLVTRNQSLFLHCRLFQKKSLRGRKKQTAASCIY